MAPPKKKKRSSSASHPKPTSSAPPPTTGSPQSDPQSAVGLELDPSVKVKCTQALTSLRRGNHTKALKLIRDSLSRHNNSNGDSAILHYTDATIHFETAALIDMSTAKRKHLKKAAESAQRAVALSPSSLTFGLLHVRVLFELEANGDKGCIEAVQECERALLIENPVDPIQDSLEDDEDGLNDSSPELRVEKVKQELRELVEKSRNPTVKGGPESGSESGPPLKTSEEMKALQDRQREIEARINGARKRIKGARFLQELEMSQKSRNEKERERKHEVPELRLRDDRFTERRKRGNGYERSPDSQSSIEHLRTDHIVKLHKNFELVVPEIVDDKSIIEMVENGVWKPVDTLMAAKIVENLSRFEPHSVLDTDSPDKDLSEFKDCPPVGKSSLTEIDEWPSCDDGEREEVLQKIRELLQLFLRKKCFARSHLLEVIRLTKEMLQSHIPESQIKNHGLDGTLLLVRLLEAPQLKHVHEFLEELARSCALRNLSEERYSDERFGSDRAFCVKERIVFSSDLSSLLLDGRYMQAEFFLQHQNADSDDGTAVSSAHDDGENDELLDYDPFVDWLWVDTSMEEVLEVWTTLIEANKDKAMYVSLFLESDFNYLQIKCEEKRECLSKRKVLLDVESLCLEENRKRKQISEHDPQSLMSFLSKRQKELERQGDAVKGSSSSELNIISSVLEHAQADICIEMKIREQKEALTRELCKLDAVILATNITMRLTEQKLALTTVCDYRSILVTLLRSFIREHLEDLVDKDAKAKSDAAEKVLLEELDLEAKERIDKGGDTETQERDKYKDKKKRRVHKKGMDFKEQVALPQESEQGCFSVERGDYPNTNIVVPVSADELKRGEELEMEELERKLNDRLEYQRQIEEEARTGRAMDGSTNPEDFAVGCLLSIKEQVALPAQESADQGCFSVEGGDYPNTKIVVPVSADELKRGKELEMEDLVDKDDTMKSDAAVKVLLEELDLDAKESIDEGCDTWIQVRNKSKDKKYKRGHRKAMDFKEQVTLRQESAEHGCFSVERGDYPNTNIVVPVSADELKRGELERKLDERLEYQRQIEQEARTRRDMDDSTNPEDFAVGCLLSIKTTLGDEFEGQVITFNRDSNILILQEGSKPGPRRSVRFLNASYIKELSFLGQGEDPLDIEKCFVDLTSLQAKEDLAIRKAEAEADRIGVGVTSEAQNIFDALSKTLPVRWDKTVIVVMKEVRVCSPYLSESVSGGTPAANARVKKVLEFERKRWQAHGGGTIGENVTERLPVVSFKPGEEACSSDPQQQPKNSAPPSVPVTPPCFGTFTWPDLRQAEKILESNTKSSMRRQPKNTEHEKTD
ncbi:hypothetical protein CJ030_MR3G026344 [Morella rubra]|uniref:AD domain-containing protein n=1 Tax=Morella rubra TaxID=262757 RepID=A0A6A1VZQ5_9ROSI|nr:hypothetical protein CJ030_MR3G026344 [Morella rubra]